MLLRQLDVLCFLKAAFLLIGSLVPSFWSCDANAAQDVGGIRFETSLSLRLEKLGQHPSTRSPTADLDVVVFVSAHAIGSNFSGVRAIHVQSSKPAQSTDYQVIWADAACHPDRGYPYLAIKKVTGRVDNESGPQTVDARPRTLGKPLPPDEIASDSRASPLLMHSSTSDRFGEIRSLSFLTRQSQIRIDIRLVRIKC